MNSVSGVPRLAATILVLAKATPHVGYRYKNQKVWDSNVGNDFEVLMVKRHGKARFVPNTYVFPGGGIDPEDREEGLRYIHSHQLSTEDEDNYASRVGALRELSEETGALIHPDGTLHTVGEATGMHGTDVVGNLATLGRWVTPEGFKYRYDTFFFGTVVHSACQGEKAVEPQECSLVRQEKEILDIIWISPREALRLHEDPSNDFDLPTPTFFLLHALDQEKRLCNLEKLWQTEIKEKKIPPVSSITQTFDRPPEQNLLFTMPANYYVSVQPSSLLKEGRYKYISCASPEGVELAEIRIGSCKEGDPIINLKCT